MAHFVSQPLLRPLASYPTSRSWRAAPLLPDAYDSRYPRRWWIRVLRLVASAWWAPLVVYLTQAATLLLLNERAARFTAVPDGAQVARALRIDWAPVFIVEQPAGLALLALGLLALLLALAAGVAAGRWAKVDRRREAEVLLVRLARPEERVSAAFVEQALAPALAWRLRTARLRRRLISLALALVAVVLGIMVALGARPIGG
jgi:hypothetical protein